MTRHRLDQLLKRHGLVRLENSDEVRRAFTVFQERTRGLAEVAWQSNNWSLDQIAKAFEQYGFDCYTQGLFDATTLASRHPDIFKAALDAANSTIQGKRHV